ncbi:MULTISPECIES: spore protease YyaC [Aeribacillus]|uniref:Spore protease YyaC n=1 Tax=Aeribacillus pallidus TaxID=33936 RepID=A0A223E329_9BACI|nr:spore protease YyaC [Aeribacillus pallidus]ASS89664.1 spore protease YyaC [Aeribacillus pallidus]
MNIKTNFFPYKKEKERIFYHHTDAVTKLSLKIGSLIPKEHQDSIVVLCIGTDRSTGDALGPIVGTKLMEQNLTHVHIFGTLKSPVHAVNLGETIETINNQFEHPFIIAVDACLGLYQNIGSFQVAEGPLKPGAAVNKSLPAVGDMHITGIVNVSGFMEFFVLQNTRLHLVMSMADVISASLINTFNSIRESEQSNVSLFRRGFEF